MAANWRNVDNQRDVIKVMVELDDASQKDAGSNPSVSKYFSS